MRPGCVQVHSTRRTQTSHKEDQSGYSDVKTWPWRRFDGKTCFQQNDTEADAHHEGDGAKPKFGVGPLKDPRSVRSQ